MADTKTLLVVSGGTVVDAHLVPSAAAIAKDGSSVSWGDTTIPAPNGLTYVDQQDAAIGWVMDGGKLVAPPEPPALPPSVPEFISDRQFFQQLASDGDITEDEALAAVMTGTMPKKLTDAIASLPAEQQFPAKMLVCGATQFERSNPMVPGLGQALGKSATDLDAIWTAAAKL